ncbi:ABC transporter permease [bacterium]|nr:ABC transporter permease [bacterium]
MAGFDLSSIITLSLFAAALRMATPIIFATMGGIFSSHTGIFNVGLEGFMLIGAFFAVYGSVQTGSALGGLLFAVVACLIASFVFALLHLELKANPVIVGLAMNIVGIGMTNYFLTALLDVYGVYKTDLIVGFQEIQIPVIHNIPILGELLSGHFPLVYLSLLTVYLVYLVLYKTPFGFRLRAVGEKIDAAESIGVNAKRMKYYGLLVSGLLCAFGGTFLSLSYLTLFSENMTAGRGWLALAAINFGRMKPVPSMIACLIFGLADALAVRLQQFGLPSQVVLLLPYLMTLIVLFASAVIAERRKKAGIEDDDDDMELATA